MSEVVSTSLNIGGMTCSNCVESINTVLREIPGVHKIDISLMTESAMVEHSSFVSDLLIKDTIEDCGFDLTVTSSSLKIADQQHDLLQISLKIFGMTCSNCSNSIESALTSLEGVKSCHVSLTTEELDIQYDSSVVGVRDIVSLIEDCGFDAVLNSNLDLSSQLETLAKIKEVKYWRWNFIMCLIVGSPVVVFGHLIPSFMKRHHHQMMMSHSIGPVLIPGIYLDHICEFVLTTYLQFFIGWKFYVNAWKALKHGSGTMDLLVCISTTITYLYSIFSMLYALITHSKQAPDVLFPTSAMLFIFISLGKWLENKAKGHTSTLLSKLLSLTPPTCNLVENFNEDLQDITTSTIAVELLQQNDILLLKPGSKIPTDGVVIFGEGEVDESLLTGESMPVSKSKGSKLIGGSVNGSNVMYLRVTHIGESTQLQQIVKLVKDAQLTKAPIQRYADMIASKFVPTILMLSLITFCCWYFVLYVYYIKNWKYPVFLQDDQFKKILQISISVIVVLCPCALGLLAPTLIMVGTGIGATNGILIKSGEFLEIAKKINYILFDKTGTLTTGEFQISKFVNLSKVYNDQEIWQLVGSIEQNSEHPIGKSLYHRSQQESHLDNEILIKELNFESSLGVSSSVVFKGQLIQMKLGNLPMIRSYSKSNDTVFEQVLSSISNSEVSTITHIMIDDEYIGYIELADTIKEELYSTVKYLQSRGYTIGMCTGDNFKSLIRTGNLLGLSLENIFYEKTPIDKSNIIKSLQEDLNTVSFIGDGTNDAPLLIQADLGILISSGTDVAIESADVVLLDGSLHNIISTLDISISTFNRIQLNFIWAMIYNLVMLPFAMGCFMIPFGIVLNPMYASLSMAFSSISVVMSSLLLKKWKPPILSETQADLEMQSSLKKRNFWNWITSLFRGGSQPSAEYVELDNMPRSGIN